jgi:hypothetical protein
MKVFITKSKLDNLFSGIQITTYNNLYKHDLFVYKQTEKYVYISKEFDTFNSQNKPFEVK